MGSTLRARGWTRDEPTVLANLLAPALVEEIHGSHVQAGARVLSTNTFTALMLGGARCHEAVSEGVRIARRSAGTRCRVAGTVAAFGLAVDDPQLADVVRILVDEGVDLLLFETCNKPRDAARALDLRQELAPDLPAVVCASTTTGDRDDHVRVRRIVSLLRDTSDPQVEPGLNCCRGPSDTLRLGLADTPPVRWVKPSTGVPTDRVDDGVMAAFARAAYKHGMRFIGGCCGTTAETLAAMGAALAAGGPHPARADGGA